MRWMVSSPYNYAKQIDLNEILTPKQEEGLCVSGAAELKPHLSKWKMRVVWLSHKVPCSKFVMA